MVPRPGLTGRSVGRQVGWLAGRSTLCHNRNRETDRSHLQNMDATFTHTTQHTVHNMTVRSHPLIDFQCPPYLRFCSNVLNCEYVSTVYGRDYLKQSQTTVSILFNSLTLDRSDVGNAVCSISNTVKT